MPSSVAASAVLLASAALAAQGSGVWLEVPFVPQQRNGCGAAVIAMVLQYWNHQQGQPVEVDPQADP